MCVVLEGGFRKHDGTIVRCHLRKGKKIGMQCEPTLFSFGPEIFLKIKLSLILEPFWKRSASVCGTFDFFNVWKYFDGACS